MTTTITQTRQADVITPYRTLLDTANKHWLSTVRQSTITTVDNTLIHYAWLHTENPTACIVIATGRAESYLKYKDLAWQLNTAGYSVLLYDHRGQGLSGRMLKDPLKGYVHTFDHYVSDLKHLYDTQLTPQKPTRKILLSHSMGGTISALYAIKYPEDFDALVLSSPMLGLPSGRWGKYLASAIDTIESTLYRWFGRESGYVPCIEQYANISFEKNNLTHSHERYENMATLARETPGIALGNPTIHWVHEAYRAFDAIFADLMAISSPVLLLQACADKVVCNSAQNTLHTQLRSASNMHKLVSIEGARHELLNETAPFRDIAVDSILTFIAAICKNTKDYSAHG